MNKLILALLAVITALSISACEKMIDIEEVEEREKEQAPKGLVLTFGTFYGMCQGDECVEMFKIETDILYEDKKDDYPFIESNNRSYQWDNYSGLHSEAAFELLEEYHIYSNELLTLDSQTFGCPDCHDQGGIYLNINNNGDERTFLIDTEAVSSSSEKQYEYPVAIVEMAEEIMEAVGELKAQ